MRGFSKAIIAGNLTRDPEMRMTPNGASACGFAVAVNRKYKGADGELKDDVSYIDCTAWGKQGETIAQYLKKGDPILVSGRLSQHSWEDKDTGAKRSRTEIVVEDFNFINGGQRDSDSFTSGYATTPTMSVSYSSEAKADMAAQAAKKAAESAPDDIPEGEIDLGEIPF